jgi:hypothetical protein
MTAMWTRAAVAIASAVLAVGFTAGVAQAKNRNPNPNTHHGCVMYNGTVLTDGQSYTTSSGTKITCIDGFVCRTLSSGRDIPCQIESGTVARTEPTSLA